MSEVWKSIPNYETIYMEICSVRIIGGASSFQVEIESVRS